MSTTNLPMDAGGVQVTPSLPPQVPVSNEMQQTLALMLGLWHGQRIPVKVGANGVVRVNDSVLAGVIHVTAAGAGHLVTGTRITVTSLFLMAHPDNTGRIWVRAFGVAAATNGIPLDAGDNTNMAIDCYSNASALIEDAGDVLIVGFIN